MALIKLIRPEAAPNREKTRRSQGPVPSHLSRKYPINSPTAIDDGSRSPKDHKSANLRRFTPHIVTNWRWNTYVLVVTVSKYVISKRCWNRSRPPGEPVPSDTLGGKPLFRVSLQRSLRSLPPFQGASGDEFMGGCSLEGWQGRRVFPPPVGRGTSKRVLLQECPGPPPLWGLRIDSNTSLKSQAWRCFYPRSIFPNGVRI